MFAAPSSPMVAGIQSSVVAVLLLAFGYLLVDAVAWRSHLPVVTRLGLAFPALAGYAFVLQVLHIATDGWVFATPWVVRVLTAVVAAGLVAWKVVRLVRRPEKLPDHVSLRGPALLSVGLAVAAAALWGSKAFRLLPLSSSGDTPAYMGYSAQLLNGETTPSALVSGHIPNQYPWLFNSLVATVARLTPGGRTFHTLGVLQLMLPAAGVLSLFALGWELTRRWEGASAAALFGGFLAGFTKHYTSGLVRRPYNVALVNLSPPYPGDMTIVLLVGFLLLATVGMVRKKVAALVGAGVVLGLAGLTGAEAFFVGLLVACLLVVWPAPLGRLRTAAALLGPAIALYAVWLVPIVPSYMRLGGFVNITKVGPVNLGPVEILQAWGLVVPFAAYGFARIVTRVGRDPAARMAIFVGVAAAIILFLSGAIPGALGQAFLALGRRHRYWPLLHLGLVVLAALGVADLADLVRRSGVTALKVAAALLTGAVVFAGLRYPWNTAFSHVSRAGAPLLLTALEGDQSSVLNVLGQGTGQRCVAAVPNEMQIPAFGYTGYRMVLYRWPGYTENLARIRWRDVDETGPGDHERVEANRILVSGNTDPPTWQEAAKRFDVNVVVVSTANALSPVFDPYDRVPAAGTHRDYVVVRIRTCA